MSKLEFVASMTVCPSDIAKIQSHLLLAEATVSPLQSILVTPLFSTDRSLARIRELAESGSKVIFDSGGYYVQIGRVRYEDLYMPLLDSYRSNPWASLFTLPDHVPTTQDSQQAVARKVADTIAFSSMFFHELPDELKERAMPVVQGRTLEQIDACLQAYIALGVKHIGFGSFGTAGKNSEINVTTSSSIDLARHVTRVAKAHCIRTHVFGVGRPALLAMIKGIEADSFDSSSWLKAAGFGQIFLPFMRGYNVTYDANVSKLELSITYEQFREWVKLTGHKCRLCEQFPTLQNHKMYRAVHNLIVVAETVKMINSGDYAKIREIYEVGSIKYRNEYAKWLHKS